MCRMMQLKAMQVGILLYIRMLWLAKELVSTLKDILKQYNFLMKVLELIGYILWCKPAITHFVQNVITPNNDLYEQHTL